MNCVDGPLYPPLTFRNFRPLLRRPGAYQKLKKLLVYNRLVDGAQLQNTDPDAYRYPVVQAALTRRFAVCTVHSSGQWSPISGALPSTSTYPV